MLEPAGSESFLSRNALFRSLVSRLDAISGKPDVLPLILLARPHPRDGDLRYWSSTLETWFPPLPSNGSSPRESPLHVLAVRSGTGWMIRKNRSGSGLENSGEILWRIALSSGEERKGGSPETAKTAQEPSDRKDPSFSSRPDVGAAFVERTGPLPGGLPISAFPERCWLDIRWPVVPDESAEGEVQEKESRIRAPSIPFRLEVSFTGDRSIVLGGVYEPSGRRMSIHARSSDGQILSRWNRMRSEVFRDLDRVLDIRLDDRMAQKDGADE